MKRRLLSLLLAAAAALLLALPAFAADAAPAAGLTNFRAVRAYPDSLFTDLPDAWYTDNVVTAYTLGLVHGNSPTTYNPEGSITVAETIALAARIHNIYHGGTGEFQNGSPWYQTYVDYALANGILQPYQFPSYTAAASRAQFAVLFANALPAEALPAINQVAKLPDVSPNVSYGPAVYLLYNAGILTGNDVYGTFRPSSGIRRSEVAAMVTRMALPADRRTFTLQQKPVEPTAIFFPAGTVTLREGESAQPALGFTPAEAAPQKLTWSSSAPSIASVSADGTVTAHKGGESTITVRTEKGLMTSCVIRVQAVTVAFRDERLALDYHAALTLAPILSDDAAGVSIASYSSSNRLIAEVSNAGVVTCGAIDGEATITVTLTNGQTASCLLVVGAGKPAVPVTRFLADFCRQNGQYTSEGTWILACGGDAAVSYYLEYDPALDALHLSCLEAAANRQPACFYRLTIPMGGAETCSFGAMTMADGTMSGYGVGTLRPAAFRAGAPVVFSSQKGSAADRELLAANTAPRLGEALRALYQEILLPHAYFLSDLGFTSLSF